MRFDGQPGTVVDCCRRRSGFVSDAANTILKPLIVMKVGDLRMGWRVIAATATAFAGAGAELWISAR